MLRDVGQDQLRKCLRGNIEWSETKSLYDTKVRTTPEQFSSWLFLTLEKKKRFLEKTLIVLKCNCCQKVVKTPCILCHSRNHLYVSRECYRVTAEFHPSLMFSFPRFSYPHTHVHIFSRDLLSMIIHLVIVLFKYHNILINSWRQCSQQILCFLLINPLCLLMLLESEPWPI